MTILVNKRYRLPIDNVEYEELSFGKFLQLENLKTELLKTVEDKNPNGFILITKKILELQGIDNFGEPIDTLISIFEIFRNNKINPKVLFLKEKPKAPGEKEKPKELDVLDYDERYLVYWYHLLFSRYGWTREYIDNSNLNFILLLIQEILVEGYEEKEWEYRLSEIAYPYDERTKKSKYQPLPKPHWMNPNLQKNDIKPIKIKRDMLPFGNVIDTTGGMGAYGENLVSNKENVQNS